MKCFTYGGIVMNNSKYIAFTKPEIYTELCNNPNFPLGTVFDWRDN